MKEEGELEMEINTSSDDPSVLTSDLVAIESDSSELVPFISNDVLQH